MFRPHHFSPGDENGGGISTVPLHAITPITLLQRNAICGLLCIYHSLLTPRQYLSFLSHSDLPEIFSTIPIIYPTFSHTNKPTDVPIYPPTPRIKSIFNKVFTDKRIQNLSKTQKKKKYILRGEKTNKPVPEKVTVLCSLLTVGISSFPPYSNLGKTTTTNNNKRKGSLKRSVSPI